MQHSYLGLAALMLALVRTLGCSRFQGLLPGATNDARDAALAISLSFKAVSDTYKRRGSDVYATVPRLSRATFPE